MTEVVSDRDQGGRDDTSVETETEPRDGSSDGQKVDETGQLERQGRPQASAIGTRACATVDPHRRAC